MNPTDFEQWILQQVGELTVEEDYNQLTIRAEKEDKTTLRKDKQLEK
jgi:hypothetical protein